MSRRAPPNAAAERAAQNQQTIKTLLKLEGNKSCADCKRNKHPRWASWNLGIFVCIRCSGIHRGMGTHISRVKSVDLDAWTDEQLQSVLRWGNDRANKYWEAKLAPGHVPSDAKIENFIRTKYESKRWVMDGPMPDPASLDAGGDDDAPLNVAQEKAKLERGSSLRVASTSSQPVPPAPNAAPKAAPSVDLFGDVPEPPVRPSTTDTPGARPPPPKVTAAKPTKAADSLLGLDFFTGAQSASAGRPASSSSTPTSSTVDSRSDLKQSILSLYATAPKAQPPPQQERQPSFGGMQSSPGQQQSTTSFGGLDDAFSNLNFNPPVTSPPPPKHQQEPKYDPFANFSNPAKQRSSVASPHLTPAALSGGGFFDAGQKLASKAPIASKVPQIPQQKPDPLSSNDFGDFSFAPSPGPAPSKSAALASNDLFDFSESSPPVQVPQKPSAPIPSSSTNSAFNLSAPAPPSQPTPKPAVTQPAAASTSSGFSNMDAWGSSDAWANAEPTATTTAPNSQPAIAVKAPSLPMSTDFTAWGGATGASNKQSSSFSNGVDSTAQAPTKVAPDEDFGGWSSAVPVAPASSNPPPVQSKPAGGGVFASGSDDLFSNVWE